jgi:hypothetical protein
MDASHKKKEKDAHFPKLAILSRINCSLLQAIGIKTERI